MSKSIERFEHYWIGGRLVTTTVRRTSKYRSWPQPDPISDLVAITDLQPSGLSVTAGPAATPTRLALAMLRGERLESSIGGRPVPVPPNILTELADTIDFEMERLSRNFRRLASEERQSGALAHTLNEFSIEADGWSVNVFTQGFSSIVKEPLTGADLGIITDLRTPEGNQVKASWAQAKRAEETRIPLLNLKDFREQLRRMQRHTHEAYGVVYTPERVIVFEGEDDRERFTVGELVSDMVRCQRGDTNPELIANSLDRELLIEAFVRNLPRELT